MQRPTCWEVVNYGTTPPVLVRIETLQRLPSPISLTMHTSPIIQYRLFSP